MCLPGLTIGHTMVDAAREMVESARHPLSERALIAGFESATYATDGSGFVSYLLQRFAPAHYEAIPRHLAHPYPRAFEYFDHFAAVAVARRLGWHRIKRLADAHEGDLIAWRVEPMMKEKDGGRLAVIAEVSQVISEDLWTARVYDASGVQHFDDSRGQNGLYAPGVGAGSILLHTDAHGRPVGLRIGPQEPLCDRPIAVARLGPLEEHP